MVRFSRAFAIVHAGIFDSEKQKRFLEGLGERAEIRWVAGETAASAIIAAVKDFAYDLLIAETPDRETDDKPFAGNVAAELLRNAPCDLLMVPRPLTHPTAPKHITFVFEPEEEKDCELLGRAVEVLRPQRVTIVVTKRPFAGKKLETSKRGCKNWRALLRDTTSKSKSVS